MEAAMDWMAIAGECDNTPAPLVINISGGPAGTGLTGTDSRSRKLDYKVWINRQLYVVAAGNEGSTPQTIRSPGVAKNALTVGKVVDNGYLTVGKIALGSSRGPTGDGRMKPNIVAPGQQVTSAEAGIDATTRLSPAAPAPDLSPTLALTPPRHWARFLTLRQTERRRPPR